MLTIALNFEILAGGHEDLLQLLTDLKDGLGLDEECICQRIIELAQLDQEEPLTGQGLWDKLAELYPNGGEVGYFDLLTTIQFYHRPC